MDQLIKERRKFLLAAGMVLALTTSCQFASDQNLAPDGDYLKAAKEYDALAQKELKEKHIQEYTILSEKAFKAFRKAAESGNLEAERNLGRLYQYGGGVMVSYKKSFEWYSKAANQGDPESQYALGSLYFSTFPGITHDPVEAAKWYERAAKQGHARAQDSTCLAYRFGWGVPKNPYKAYFWATVLKANNPQSAGEIYRGILIKELTPDQVSQADQEAAQWKPTLEPVMESVH